MAKKTAAKEGYFSSCRMISAKSAIFLLCFMLFIPLFSMIVFADATSLMGGAFYTDDTFTMNDKIGVINVNSYDEVIIDYDNSFILINNGTCKRLINNRLCVDGIEYDNTLKKKKATINIFYIGPDITVTRSVNKSNPHVYEGVKVTARIENKGNTTADNLTYIDLLPSEIQLIKLRKLDARTEKVLVYRNDTASWQNMTRIVWQGSVKPDEQIDIIYTMKPTAYIDASFTADIIFFDGIKDMIVKSSAMSIKTESFFEITKKFAPEDYTVAAGSTSVIVGEAESSIYIGDKVLFITEIQNKAFENETINVSYIDFYIPDGMMYEGPASFRVYTNKSNASTSYTPGVQSLKKLGKNIYRWSGLLGPDSVIFAMKLKGIRKGTHKVMVYSHLVQFKEKKKPYYEPLYDLDYYGSEEVEVKFDEPFIESNIKNGQTFDSGEKAYFTVYMQNKNEKANFTNIKALIETPWEPAKTLNFSYLKKTNYVNFFDGFVTMPTVSDPVTKKFSVNVTYESEYGEKYSAKLERTLSIRPHTPIRIAHTFSPSRGTTPEKIIIDNSESLVTLQLANSANTKIDHINVTEVVDPILSKEGNFTRIVNIDKGIIMDVLKYKINPVDVKTTKEYHIVTYVDYNSGNDTYHIAKDTLVEVNAKKMTLDVKKMSRVTTIAKGMPFYVDYTVENTADEPVENITLIFPLSENMDIIGSRHYYIKRLEKGEKISVTGKEKLRSKSNDTRIGLGKTKVIFHDIYGSEFDTNTSDQKIDMLYKPLLTPALKASRSISKTMVNRSENFSSAITVENIGIGDVTATINDFGRTFEFKVESGKKKSISHEVSADKTGTYALEPALISYEYDGESYYTASNRNEMTVIGAKEIEEAAEEKPGEAKPEEAAAPERKEMPYLKYVLLVVFIMVICFIIFSVIRMKPKEKRFDFMEE